MRLSEILHLVWINIMQNRFKMALTSLGIIVGAATIVMVLAIGRGGQLDVEDQFRNLAAGSVEISYNANSNRSSQNAGGGGRRHAHGYGQRYNGPKRGRLYNGSKHGRYNKRYAGDAVQSAGVSV
jgi:putative ABC transport system permease protein